MHCLSDKTNNTPCLFADAGVNSLRLEDFMWVVTK